MPSERRLTVDEYRSANAVNAYLTIAFGANPAQDLTHDATLDRSSPCQGQAGNLTLDPTARNLGDTPGSPTGQTYEYDEENQLTVVRRASDEELLQDVTYDALGRRIETIDYTGVSDPCGDESSPVVTRHICGVLETLEEYVLCDDGQSGQEWRLALDARRRPLTRRPASRAGKRSKPLRREAADHLIDDLSARTAVL